MTETEISPATTSEAPTTATGAVEEKTTPSKKATTTAAGKKASAAKKPARAKPNHPPAGEMVTAAIVALKDKHGSSLQAIKKYIAATYSVDADKQATFIRKYLKTAVAKKSIVQVKGSGASGSFRLATEADKKPAVSAAVMAVAKKKKKPAQAKKPAAAARKPAVQKRAKKIVKKAANVANSAKAIKASGTTSKAKTGGKAPGAAKPRTPKPKKSATAKAKVVK